MKIIIPNKRAVQYRANRVGFRAHSTVICHLAAGFGTEIGHQMVKNSEKFRKIQKNSEKFGKNSQLEPNEQEANEWSNDARSSKNNEGGEKFQNLATKTFHKGVQAWRYGTKKKLAARNGTNNSSYSKISFLSLKICRRTGKKKRKDIKPQLATMRNDSASNGQRFS